MKGKLMTAMILTALLTTGAAYSMGPGGPGRGGGPDLTKLATVLKLTQSQQTQIQSIQDAERSQIKTLLGTMKEKRDQLRKAGEGTTFDEAAVRALATAVAQQETELAVARVKAQTQVNAILTAEQREMLKSLRPDHDRRPPPDADGE
jgi:Spy/CpxP family protein refolding chaperone